MASMGEELKWRPILDSTCQRPRRPKHQLDAQSAVLCELLGNLREHEIQIRRCGNGWRPLSRHRHGEREPEEDNCEKSERSAELLLVIPTQDDFSRKQK